MNTSRKEHGGPVWRGARRFRSLAFAGSAAIIAFGAGGCSKSETPGKTAQGAQAGRTGDGAGAALPAGLFAAGGAPEGVLGVAEAKGKAKSGERVVVRGRVGGGLSPFVDGRAVMTVVDVGVKSCAEGAEDHCPTPWDYCCEPRDVLSANTATVRVIGADGQPIRATLKGGGGGGGGGGASDAGAATAGLKELDVVIVTGTVSAQSQGGVLVVDAELITIERP